VVIEAAGRWEITAVEAMGFGGSLCPILGTVPEGVNATSVTGAMHLIASR